MQESFAKVTIENFIKKYSDVEDVIKNLNGEDVWILSNGATIRLPADFSRIPYGYVEMIASVKLEMHEWEFDYWLGQQITDIC